MTVADLLARWELDQIRGFSLLQPWASLVALGEKVIETRSRPNGYRGAVATASSARINVDDGALAFRDPDFAAAWKRHPGYAARSHDLPLGVFLSVSRFVACLPTENVIGELRGAEGRLLRPTVAGVSCGISESAFGNYTPGRSGYVFAETHRLVRPVPCKGMLGFWTIGEPFRTALLAAEVVPSSTIARVEDVA
jgi:hypothetical protein